MGKTEERARREGAIFFGLMPPPDAEPTWRQLWAYRLGWAWRYVREGARDAWDTLRGEYDHLWTPRA